MLANSSFTYFPAFTSETVKYIIAPKYWARHNVSDGYWASEQNIYTGWKYMDRNGRVFTAEECREELERYKKCNKYKKVNKKPNKVTRKWMEVESELLYKLSWIERIYYSLLRKIKAKLG